eukprot:6392231-Amphidinium_carterae.1
MFSAIMGNQFDKVAQIETKDAPVWWNKGQNILQTDEDVVTALDVLDEQIAVEVECIQTLPGDGHCLVRQRTRMQEDALQKYLRKGADLGDSGA